MSHGNSVPRFHVSWGTGAGIVEPFERRARETQATGRLTFRFRHRVDGLSITNRTVDGVTGSILEPDNNERGSSSSRKVIGSFECRAQAVIVASGGRLPAPLFPGSDTLGQLHYIMGTGYDYSWFVLTQTIIKKEFALSGSEQNPDLTSKSWLMTARRATNKGAPAPVEAFKSHGVDFIVRDNLADLVAAMNKLSGDDLLKLEHLKAQIEARDREIENPYVKDAQVMNIHNARRYIGDRLIRTAKPHRILDPAHGPLIAVKLNILTRKTLGGFETDLDSRVFGSDGSILPGLYAAGEAAGFGGGGMHGYRSLEGTFLGGCLFSGRNAGRAAAKAAG